MSLWNTIKYIITNRLCETDEFIIICENDHQFTRHYSKVLLANSLINASKKGADILSGGVSCIGSSFQITDNLYWMENFTGLQFTVVFRKFFDQILNFTFSASNDADIVKSAISDKKFLMYPFISTQKEFGYSDVTEKNNIQGHVEDLF